MELGDCQQLQLVLFLPENYLYQCPHVPLDLLTLLNQLGRLLGRFSLQTQQKNVDDFFLPDLSLFHLVWIRLLPLTS